MAFDESLIRTNIKVKFIRDNAKQATLTVTGENLAWSKTINYDSSIDNRSNETKGFSDFTEELEVLMLRKFGNYSDVQYAINDFRQSANYSNLWKQCIDQRTEFELQIANEMINKSKHEKIENNLTTLYNDLKTTCEIDKSEKDTTIQNLESDKEDLQTGRTRWMYAGIIGIGLSIWLLNKYRGLGKRKHQMEGELPKDTSL
jgi:hypothetical protein